MAKSAEIDGQTDVWAAGATLFTLLCGHFVHEGDNAPQVMIRAATTPPRSLATVAPEVAPAVVEVVDRALAFDKAARWASAAEMRDALHRACLALFGQAPSKAWLVSPADERSTSDAVASTQLAAVTGPQLSPARARENRGG